MKIAHCKAKRLKKRPKCSKKMNAEGEIHHIYPALLFSLHLPVGKRDAVWKKKSVRFHFLHQMYVSMP